MDIINIFAAAIIEKVKFYVSKGKRKIPYKWEFTGG